MVEQNEHEDDDGRLNVKLSFDVEDRLVDVIIGGSDDNIEDGCFGTSILCICDDFKFVLKFLRLQLDMNDRLLLMHCFLLYCGEDVAIVE